MTEGDKGADITRLNETPSEEIPDDRKTKLIAFFQVRAEYLQERLTECKAFSEDDWRFRLIHRALYSTWGDLTTLGVDPKQLLKDHTKRTASQTRDNQPPL